MNKLKAYESFQVFLKYKYLLLILFVIQIVLSLVIAQIHLLSNNTLKNNGRWLSTKTTLEMWVMGADNYVDNRQSLAQCRLNLDAWHGYQEVIYKEKISPKEINFNFLLSENSYFYFIFNKDNEKFSSLRFSVNKAFENMYIVSYENGKFIKKIGIPSNNIKINQWNFFKIIFYNNSFLVYLNGNLIKNINEKLLNKQFFGFRGSSRIVLVDDVFVIEKDNKTIQEKFHNKKNCIQAILSSLGVIMFLNFAFLLQGMRKKTLVKTIKSLFVSNLVIFIILISFLLLDFYVIAKSYPNPNGFFSKLRKKEEIFVQKEIDRINKEILLKYKDTNEDTK